MEEENEVCISGCNNCADENEEHLCPKALEVEGEEEICTCCDACTDNCAMSI